MRVRLVEVAEYHELSVLITTLVCKTMNCIALAVCRERMTGGNDKQLSQ
jgi:hypothetical protein